MALLPGSQSKITVSVQVSNDLANPDERKKIKAALLEYLAEMLDSLGIRSRLDVSVSRRNVPSRDELSLIRMTVNRSECRLPPFRLAPGDATFQDKLSYVSNACVANRELFVSEQAAQTAIDELVTVPAQFGKKLSAADKHEIARALVRRCYSIGMIVNLPAKFSDTDMSIIELTEDLASEPLHAQMHVRYDKRLEEAIGEQRVDGRSLDEMAGLLRDGLFYDLGLVLPRVEWVAEESLAPGEFQIKLNDLVLPIQYGLGQDQMLVNDRADRLKMLNVDGVPSKNPANNFDASIVGIQDLETCQRNGFYTWGPGGYIVLTLNKWIKHFAGSFIGKDIVENNLDGLAEVFPKLVTVVRDRFDTFVLTSVLRGLLDEGVSILDLRRILETMLSINGTTDVDLHEFIVAFAECTNYAPGTVDDAADLMPEEITDYVRSFGLRRQISSAVTRSESTIRVFLVDQKTGRRLRESDSKPLSNREKDKLLRSMSEVAGDALDFGPNLAVLCDYDTRRELRELVGIEFPDLPVLSYQELSPQLSVQPLATISVD